MHANGTPQKTVHAGLPLLWSTFAAAGPYIRTYNIDVSGQPIYRQACLGAVVRWLSSLWSLLLTTYLPLTVGGMQAALTLVHEIKR